MQPAGSAPAADGSGRRTSLVLANATLVLPDAVVRGSLYIERGDIAAISPGGRNVAGAIDMGGDYILPGVVDLHTDNLERQVQPRAGVRWPSRSAFLAHDSQCAAAGVTTVLDALCIGTLGFDEDRPRTTEEGIADLTALAPTGLLKSDHFLHLRCELPADGVVEKVEQLASHPLLRLASLMDHTPGIGQYADLEHYRAMCLRDGTGRREVDRRIRALSDRRARLRDTNRAALLALLHGRVPLASHDDRTSQEVSENIAASVALAEFPVTAEAAETARSGGQGVIVGAPNLVRGGSHTGNVAAVDLLRAGLVDALASDYVPCSLIDAAFRAVTLANMSLPRAVAMVSDAPARMLGMSDRGRIEVGRRADLVRVRMHEGAPVVRQVWRCGERMA